MKFTLSALLCFSAIYTLKIFTIPVPMAFILWPVCLIYLYWCRPFLLVPHAVQSGIVLPIAWIAFLTAFSVLISILRGEGQDFSIPYNFLIWGGLFIPSGYVLALTAQGGGRQKSRIDIQSLLVVVMTIQALCIYFAFFFPEFREASARMLGDESGGALDIGGTRVKGFSGSGGAALSLIQGIGVAISIKLFVDRGKGRYLLFAIVTAGSIMFTGRTGLIFVALFLVMYLPFCILAGKLKWRKALYFALALGLFTYSFFNILVDDEHKELIEGAVLVRSFDIFESVLSGNVNQHSTMEEISEMYKMPVTTMGILFGDGLYLVNGVDYAGDPGYIKYVFYFGFLGCIAFYGYFLMLMVLTIRHCASALDRAFIFILYFLFFLMETKEPFFAKTNVILHLLYFYAIQTSRVRRQLPVVACGETGAANNVTGAPGVATTGRCVA